MAETILITGATGNVGMEIIGALRGSGHTAARRCHQRRAGARAAWRRHRLRHVRFRAPGDVSRLAYAGVTRMFLMRPPQISDIPRYITPAIVAAKQAGVQQIVFLSLLGVEKNTIVPHAKVEAAILAAGVPYTFLRPSFFMQNLSTTHRDEIRDGSEIFVPAGHGATSFIDARDIAAVAALALTEDGHANKAYPLTGSAALTYRPGCRDHDGGAWSTNSLPQPIAASVYRPSSSAWRSAGVHSGHVRNLHHSTAWPCQTCDRRHRAATWPGANHAPAVRRG